MTTRLKKQRALKIKGRQTRRQSPQRSKLLTRSYRATRRIVQGIEESPFVRLLAIIALSAFPIQLAWDYDNREQEALARNWALLATPSSGNSGKAQAITFLASRDIVLDGIDVSCKSQGGEELDADGNLFCARPPYVGEADLSRKTHGRSVSLRNANFNGANLYRTNFGGANLEHSSFSNANLNWTFGQVVRFHNSDFTRATLYFANLVGSSFINSKMTEMKVENSRFDRANLHKADMRSSKIYRTNFTEAVMAEVNLSGTTFVAVDFTKSQLVKANFHGATIISATFTNANLSGANFTDAKILGDTFQESWAWSDMRPIGLLHKIKLCKYEAGNRWWAPKACIEER